MSGFLVEEDDQTITLTGDVTGSGTGSFAATIANDAVTLAKMASGTAGNLITYDASGDPAAVATGTVGQVLTSGGAGVAPTMQTPTVGGELGSDYSTTTGGTSIDFTGIPADTKMIEIQAAQISHNGSDQFVVQIGDSGGFETSGYSGVKMVVGSGSRQTYSASFLVTESWGGAHVGSFTARLLLMNGNQWGIWSTSNRQDSNYNSFGQGAKTLSAALDRLRITTAAGTVTFDLNSGVAIRYFG
jgi:hypothetical protein